ncbi:hypothetical protein LWV26_24490, partial [Enterobacter kobei]|nr:hypothetical protein [Enterobacter kobei]
FGFAENTDDLFVGKTLLHGDVLMWLMKTLLTSGCTNQRGAGHRNDVMLNAGLLGGTRADVMAFAQGIIRLYYRIESYRFWKKEQAGAAVGDMMAFGIVAKSFGDRIVTGPRIHTVFKSEGIGKEYAWFKHK